MEQLPNGPVPGESMADFLARNGSPAESPKAEYVEPTLEEQKRIIRDPSVPEPIRRFWRTKLYGAGGSGRKAIQQETALRHRDATVPGQHRRESVTKGLTGKQKKNARRLLRQAAKVMKNAA